MQNINNNRINFHGAYIIKGSAKAVKRFQMELDRKKFIERKFDVYTTQLTDFYHDDQPYMELLVCTDNHIRNFKNYLQKSIKENEKKVKRFADDFNGWTKEKKDKWVKAINEAVAMADECKQKELAPGEKGLKEGNPDVFLDWYNSAIKKSNEKYEEISRAGSLRFPAKIRRIDADKAFNALVDNNFNIKEGFIRNNSNKLDIVVDGNKEYRYKNNKFTEIITYKNDPEEGVIVDMSEKFYYDKNGKFKKIIKRDANGDVVDIVRKRD